MHKCTRGDAQVSLADTVLVVGGRLLINFFLTWGSSLSHGSSLIIFNNLLRLEPHYYLIGWGSSSAQALVMARASLLFLELRLEPLSWLEPHYFSICWGSSQASLSFSEWGSRHLHDSIPIIQILKCPKATPSQTSDTSRAGQTPLYAFMQCINMYKKYWPGHSQVDIFMST